MVRTNQKAGYEIVLKIFWLYSICSSPKVETVKYFFFLTFQGNREKRHTLKVFFFIEENEGVFFLEMGKYFNY